jgi:drug/metabolite transporter (DMT)-like permease
MHKDKKALLLLILGTIFISFAGIFVKWTSVDGKLSSFYRTFYGSISLLLLLPIFLKGSSNLNFLKDLKFYKYLVIAGGFFGVDLYIWHQSIHYIGAGLGTVIANSQIFFIAILSSIFLKEQILRSFIYVTIFAFIGIFLTAMDNGNFELNKNMLFGVSLAILAGFLYSLFLFFLKKHRNMYPLVTPIIPWFLLSVTAMTTIMTLLLINHEITFDISVKEHLILFALGFFVQALAWIAISKAMTSMNLFHVSMTLLSQPVLACVWGIIFFNETYHLIQLIGLIIALTMIILGQFLILNQNKLPNKYSEEE